MANPATATAAMIPLVTISAGSRQRMLTINQITPPASKIKGPWG